MVLPPHTVTDLRLVFTNTYFTADPPTGRKSVRNRSRPSLKCPPYGQFRKRDVVHRGFFVIAAWQHVLTQAPEQTETKGPERIHSGPLIW